MLPRDRVANLLDPGSTFLEIGATAAHGTYDAHHDVISVKEADPGTEYHPYDVVGPVCETGDTFAKARPLPPLKDGDLWPFGRSGPMAR